MKILVTIINERSQCHPLPSLTILTGSGECDPLLDAMLASKRPVKECLIDLVRLAEIRSIGHIARRPEVKP